VNIEPLIYLIAHAPVEPQAWFEPVMPERPMLPDDTLNLRCQAGWPTYERTGSYKFMVCLSDDEKAWLEEHAADHKAYGDWSREYDKQRLIQWPAAWAHEQLKHLKTLTPPTEDA
jgi:hypothetical protein